MLIFPLFFPDFRLCGKSEATGVPAIALVDEDKSMISEKFTRMLTAHAGIRVEPLDREEAHKKLDTHKIEGVFVLTDGFGQKIESGDMNSLFEYTAALLVPEGYFLNLFPGGHNDGCTHHEHRKEC